MYLKSRHWGTAYKDVFRVLGKPTRGAVFKVKEQQPPLEVKTGELFCVEQEEIYQAENSA